MAQCFIGSREAWYLSTCHCPPYTKGFCSLVVSNPVEIAGPDRNVNILGGLCIKVLRYVHVFSGPSIGFFSFRLMSHSESSSILWMK